MVECLQTANNTSRPVPLALHPNFAPLHYAKLRPCSNPLVAICPPIQEKDNRALRKEDDKNNEYQEFGTD